MSEQTPNVKKRALPLPLVVTSFLLIIIFIAWVSVKIVHYAPVAFSSLASLAETLQEHPQTTSETDDAKKITITSNVTLANAGDTITLTWGEPSVVGTFTFSYACHEGMSVELVDQAGVRTLNCDTNYNIGNNTTLALKVSSEKERYADLVYTVAFLGTNDTTPRASGTAQLTIINTDVKNSVAATPEPTTETTPEPTTSETPDSSNQTTPTTPSYTQEYVYTIPTSNPHGTIDVGTNFLNTGTIVGNTFFAGNIKRNVNGAIQFAVKNYGTKTSGNWTFTVSLPDGSTYTSPTQTPLKPNERAVLTIGFMAANTSSHTFTVVVTEASDTYTLNNSFKQLVKFY